TAGSGNRRFRSSQGPAILARPSRQHSHVGSSDPGVQPGGRRHARSLENAMTVRTGKTTGETAPSYMELREKMSRRDRSLRDKVVSLEQAASFVRDGDSVGIGGSTMSRTPMGMIWALIRAGRKGLTCSRSIVSSDGDLLLASGVCDHIVTSWFS